MGVTNVETSKGISSDGLNLAQSAGLPDTGIGQSSFVPHLLHELRNLFAPIQNSLHVIRLSGDDATKQAALAIVDTQVNTLRGILDRLSTMDQLTRVEVVTEDESFELTEVLDRVIAPARSLFTQRRQTFDFTPPTGALPVRGRKSGIVYVLSEVLENAAKFTPEGGQIWLDVTVLDGEVRLRVRDTGMGIAPELLPRMLVSPTVPGPAAHGEGPHLGASLLAATKIIGRHGGRVTIASEGADKGTECTIVLPLLRLEAIAVGARVLAPRRTTVRQSHTRSRGATGPQRVLVVDDSRAVRESLATIVRELGHEVKFAIDGEEGLRLAREWLPSFVLLDIHLPKLNGYDIARALSQQFAADDMILIMIGGDELNDATLRGARDAGFDYCIDKMQTYELLKQLLPSS